MGGLINVVHKLSCTALSFISYTLRKSRIDLWIQREFRDGDLDEVKPPSNRDSPLNHCKKTKRHNGGQQNKRSTYVGDVTTKMLVLMLISGV